MTHKEYLKRKIELKNQLILLTEIEIAELEKALMADRVIPENRQPEPASAASSTGR